MGEEPGADGSDVGGCSVVGVQRFETVDILSISIRGTDELGQSTNDGRNSLRGQRGETSTKRVKIRLSTLSS